MSKKKLIPFINLLFLLLGFYLIYRIGEKTGWAKIWAEISKLEFYHFAIILALPLVWQTLHSFGWFAVVENKKNFNFLTFLGAHLSAAAVSEAFPLGQAGGEPYRAYFVKKRSPKKESANIIASIILYHTIHAIITGLFFALGFIATLSYVKISLYKRLIFIGAILLAFILLMRFIAKQKKGMMSGFFDILSRFKFLEKLIERKRERAVQIDERLNRFYTQHKVYFFISFTFILAAKIMGAVEFYVIFKFLNVDVSFLEAFIIFSGTAVIQMAFFFTPGQVGITEGSIVGMMKLLGKKTNPGFTLGIIRRGRVVFWTIIGLIIGMIWGPKFSVSKNKKNPLEENAES